MEGIEGIEGMDRMDMQYLDGCERGRREREVEERGVLEALGISRFVVLRGVAWYCKGIA